MVDSNTIYLLTGKLIVGTLLFIRIMGMVVSGPVFRSSAIPGKMKAIFALILAVSVTSAFWTEQPQIDFHLWNMVLLVLKEFLVGIMIGFSANAVFWGARLAGGLIDFDMGYHTSQMFNQEEGAPTIVGELKFMAILMMFIGMNGHHVLIEGVFASVKLIPLTTFTMGEASIYYLSKLATDVMIIGVKLSAPLLVAIFMANLALALLARVAPQTNIFILSFQMKIVVGLLVLFATVPLFIMMGKHFLQDVGHDIIRLLQSVGP